MKQIIAAVFLALYAFQPIKLVSQKSYDELLVLFVDEKYDKCFYKCVKYIEGSKTKRDPLPYLYASMAMYEMSREHEYIDDYPNAYKEALSYLTKYRSKDKAYAFRSDAEEHIEKMKLVVYEEVDNYILGQNEKSYKKALGLMKKVVRFDPNCYGAQLIRGELEILTKNRSEGKKMVIAAMKNINSIGETTEFQDLTESQQLYFKYAIMMKSELLSKSDIVKARDIISIAQPFFGEDREDCLLEDNDDFRKLYKEITG